MTSQAKLQQYEREYTTAQLVTLSGSEKRRIIEDIIGHPLSTIFCEAHNPLVVARMLLDAGLRPTHTGRVDADLRSEWFFHNRRRIRR